MKKPVSGITRNVTKRYISKLNIKRPISHAAALQMAEELFSTIVIEFEAANALQAAGSRYKVPDDLSPYAIARLILYSFHIVRIDLGGKNSENHPLALYIEDLYGEPPRPDKGIYSIDPDEFKKIIRLFVPTITRAGIKEVIDVLETMVEHVPRCQNKNIIPVNNGLYNYETKELMPFSPDYVFKEKD